MGQVIGFFGDGGWSHNALKRLLEDQKFEIAFVCARFSHPDQRLKQIAEKHSIPFFTIQNVNNHVSLITLKQYNCDLFVSMSFDQIFKSDILELPRLGIINCHAGELPFYRGRNVLNWVLINDEKRFGITVHHVDEGIDTGDIILQKTYEISDLDDYNTLLERAYIYCGDLLKEAVYNVFSGKYKVIPQNSVHPHGFYCSRRAAGDERINWNWTSRRIFNFVRSLCLPGPRATTEIKGSLVLINRVVCFADAPRYIGIPGSVLNIKNGILTVKTGDSFLEITDFESDVPLKVGDRLD